MTLHKAVEQYVQVKQSLGFRFHAENVILTAFAKAMGKVSLSQVKPRAVRVYLDGKGPVTRHWHRKWETLRLFYRFARARGLVRHSPLPAHAPKLDATFTPYIYTPEELRALLQAITPERTGGLAPPTVRVLLLLLYGAGLRISEALNLEHQEVDLSERLLHIRQSKFFKTRWVPIGPKLTQILQDHRRQRPTRSHPCFFLSTRGTPISRSTIERIFARLRSAAGVQRTDGGRFQPRLHDLRQNAGHGFAPFRGGPQHHSNLARTCVAANHPHLRRKRSEDES